MSTLLLSPCQSWHFDMPRVCSKGKYSNWIYKNKLNVAYLISTWRSPLRVTARARSRARRARAHPASRVKYADWAFAHQTALRYLDTFAVHLQSGPRRKVWRDTRHCWRSALKDAPLLLPLRMMWQNRAKCLMTARNVCERSGQWMVNVNCVCCGVRQVKSAWVGLRVEPHWAIYKIFKFWFKPKAQLAMRECPQRAANTPKRVYLSLAWFAWGHASWTVKRLDASSEVNSP